MHLAYAYCCISRSAFRGDSSHSGLVMGIARIPRTKVVTSLHALTFSFAYPPFCPYSTGASLRPFTFTHSPELCAGACRLQPYVCTTHANIRIFLDFRISRISNMPILSIPGIIKIVLTFYQRFPVILNSSNINNCQEDLFIYVRKFCTN